MKLRSVAIMMGLGVMAALILAGWHLGSPSVDKAGPLKPSVQTALSQPQPLTDSQSQTQPFELAESPPYGPAVAPEEMKPLPTPAETGAYLRQQLQSAKGPENKP